MDDTVDVGVFAAGGEDDDKDGVPLLVEKQHITSGQHEIVLVVDREPARAGIDPYNKLIDRKPSDNVVRVHAAAGQS